MKHYELLSEDDSEYPLHFVSFIAIDRIHTTVKVHLEVDDIEIDRALATIAHPVENQLEPVINELKQRLREALPYQIEKLERVLATLKKVQEVGDVKLD